MAAFVLPASAVLFGIGASRYAAAAESSVETQVDAAEGTVAVAAGTAGVGYYAYRNPLQVARLASRVAANLTRLAARLTMNAVGGVARAAANAAVPVARAAAANAAEVADVLHTDYVVAVRGLNNRIYGGLQAAAQQGETAELLRMPGGMAAMYGRDSGYTRGTQLLQSFETDVHGLQLFSEDGPVGSGGPFSSTGGFNWGAIDDDFVQGPRLSEVGEFTTTAYWQPSETPSSSGMAPEPTGFRGLVRGRKFTRAQRAASRRGGSRGAYESVPTVDPDEEVEAEIKNRGGGRDGRGAYESVPTADPDAEVDDITETLNEVTEYSQETVEAGKSGRSYFSETTNGRARLVGKGAGAVGVALIVKELYDINERRSLDRDDPMYLTDRNAANESMKVAVRDSVGMGFGAALAAPFALVGLEPVAIAVGIAASAGAGYAMSASGADAFLANQALPRSARVGETKTHNGRVYTFTKQNVWINAEQSALDALEQRQYWATQGTKRSEGERLVALANQAHASRRVGELNGLIYQAQQNNQDTKPLEAQLEEAQRTLDDATAAYTKAREFVHSGGYGYRYEGGRELVEDATTLTLESAMESESETERLVRQTSAERAAGPDGATNRYNTRHRHAVVGGGISGMEALVKTTIETPPSYHDTGYAQEVEPATVVIHRNDKASKQQSSAQDDKNPDLQEIVDNAQKQTMDDVNAAQITAAAELNAIEHRRKRLYLGDYENRPPSKGGLPANYVDPRSTPGYSYAGVVTGRYSIQRRPQSVLVGPEHAAQVNVSSMDSKFGTMNETTNEAMMAHLMWMVRNGTLGAGR